MKAKSNYLDTARAMLITAFIILLAIPQFTRAQTIYKTGLGTNIKVAGTSNVHDWTMTATGIDSKGEFKIENGALVSLQAFTLSVDVKTLKSEHSSMDSRTYKAIDADKYPRITYKLNSAVVTTVSKGKYLIKTKGELTIAGATQAIAMDVNAVLNADNTITCIGSEKVKLTDYKITPPSFMLGAMKVYNDLTILFTLNYQK